MRRARSAKNCGPHSGSKGIEALARGENGIRQTRGSQAGAQGCR
ncbi:hypothetical protein [Verminephrobacter eiseniae]|nr:hypothetical protein [Verminephrobacter eiseniae]